MRNLSNFKLGMLAFGLAALGAAHGALISVGPLPAGPPPYLPTPPATAFVVPVVLSGADRQQTWQFDLLFDNSVVEQLDPLDGSAGLYGAEFSPGDAASRAFILGGFAFNGQGLVDDVSGFYPGLADGVSGDGVLAYLLFGFLPGRETADPLFRIAADPALSPSSLPEPATLALVLLCLGALGAARVFRPRAAFSAALAASVFSALTIAPATAQTVANGPYYATPSWDQTLPAAVRFVVLANLASEAVLDRETGLVWERSPSARYEPWLFSLARCEQLYLGNRMGWRLPTSQELATLVDTSVVAPNLLLPIGHPFIDVQPDFYWSGSTYPYPGLPSAKSRLRFSNGQSDGATTTLPNVGYAHSWCVRSPYGTAPP